MSCHLFLKILTMILNGLISLAGIGFLGVGVWVNTTGGSIVTKLGEGKNGANELAQMLTVTYILMAVGALIFIIGLMGFYAVISNNRILLIVFFCIVLVMCIVQVGLAVVILVFKQFTHAMLDKLGEQSVVTLKAYGASQDLTDLWHNIMNVLQCCGVYGYGDFKNTTYYETGNILPPQCCNSMIGICNETTAEIISQGTVDGCLIKIKRLVTTHTEVIAAASLGVAAIEVCAMVFALT